MFYSIIPDDMSTKTVYLPEKLYSQYNLSAGFGTINIHAGLKRVLGKIKKSSKLNSEIAISNDVLAHLCLPLNVKYQIKIELGKIIIGPVIGLLMAKKEESLTKEELDKFLVYALLYPEFQGLFYIFSEDGINFSEKETSGFYFNVDKDNRKLTWESGTFPLANSIFRRISLSQEIRRRLKAETGNNIFNSYYFDKLEFSQILMRNTFLMRFTPETRVFNNFEDLEYILSKHGLAYLKLIDGSLGHGIIRAEMSGEEYYIQGKNDERSYRFLTKTDLKVYLNKLSLYKRYIVQQGIKCLCFEERNIDFRVIMQMNAGADWQCTGIVACFGKKGGICSNYIEDSLYMSFEDAMVKIKGLDIQDIFELRRRVIDLCYTTCRFLDSTGECFGDLGMDVALDEDLKIWILEVNKEHDHRVPLFINDEQMYYCVKSNPIKYAVSLSGFEI